MPDDKWICQRCSAVNIAGSKYCRNCRKVLATVVVEKAAFPDKTMSWSTILLLLLIGILIFRYIDSCGVVKMSPEHQEEQIRQQEEMRQKENDS